jgi:hypothetical protein
MINVQVASDKASLEKAAAAKKVEAEKAVADKVFMNVYLCIFFYHLIS